MKKVLTRSLKVWYSNKAVREGGGRKQGKEGHGEKMEKLEKSS